MRPVRLKELSLEDLTRIKQRASGDFEKVSARAGEIMEAVRVHGDKAVREFTRELDKAELENFEASPQELKQALAEASPALITAMRQVIANLTAFHRSHIKAEEEHIFTDPGIE